MQLCLEEMEPDPSGVVVQEVAEVWEEVLVGWEATELGLVPVGVVSVLVAESNYRIK